MREDFPKKNVGDELSARHVNKLSDVARRFSRMHAGTNQQGIHTGSITSFTGPPPWKQYIFRVTTDNDDGTYEGLIRWYDDSAGAWKPDEDADDDTLDAEDKWDLDANGLEITLAVDDLIIAYWDGQRGAFVPIQPASSVRHFELKDAHTPGASSTAYLQTWDGDSYETDTDTEFEVVDVRGVFRGREKDAYSSPHNEGSLGEAVYRNGQWEITWMTPHALKIQGAAVGDFTAASTTIDGVTVMQPSGAIIVDQDPAAAMTIYDIFNWDGSEDDLIIAVWNENTGHWEIQEIVCP